MNFILTAGGNCLELPLDDSVVAEHCAAPSSFVNHLLSQINCARMYEPIFRGRNHLIFLDIGANMGLVSVYAHDVCDHIVAVEPAPKTFAVLERVAHRFGKISTLCAALTPDDGPCIFHVADVNTTASSVVNTYGEEIKVQGLTLKSIVTGCSLKNIDVCKVDAEGSEGKSLSLEQVAWAKPIIKSYYVETHNCPWTGWEHKLGRLVNIFARTGYHKMRVDGMSVYAERT